MLAGGQPPCSKKDDWEFSTSSKGDGVAHILQIMNSSSWNSKNMKISEKEFTVWAKKIGDHNCNYNNYGP